MSGSENSGPPLSPCGCGGKAVLWHRAVPFVDATTVEAFCTNRHCGMTIPPRVEHGAQTAKRVRLEWNRAMGAGRA